MPNILTVYKSKPIKKKNEFICDVMGWCDISYSNAHQKVLGKLEFRKHEKRILAQRLKISMEELFPDII